MIYADRLAALRAVPGCGGRSIDTEETGASFRHDTALPWAVECDPCGKLLVDAVIAHAVEGLTVSDLATLTGLDPMASPALVAADRDELRSALTRGSR